MKRIVLMVCAAGLLSATPAQASLFTLDHYDVQVHTAGAGLLLWTQDVLADGSTFTLDAVGESKTRTLFEIGTTETSLDWDDLLLHTITVGFSFTTPPPPFGDDAFGITGAFQWGFNQDPFGYVLWDNPLRIAFGTTGLLGVSLEHESFALPGSAYVNATFTLLRADGTAPTQVPEPASALLLGAGAAAVLVRRRFVTGGDVQA